jgi:pilus assembly protein FimV
LSSKKDKLLESAQKFIAKGQLDRAIKDYEQIVSLDPADIRHRQKLAELLVRANRKEDAIAEYDAIGKNYSNNAFYLKAIAVYKQIQKLDPGNVKVTMSLASLNEKQGLIGNALAEYNTALSYYQKTRQLPEAIKVLEQMMAADPGNLNTLLKYAETYFSAGVHEKSYDQFTKLAVLLGKSGDESAFRQICSRITSLFPNRRDFLLDLMSTLVEDGCVDAAIPHLLAITGKDSGNRRAWELLAEAYGHQGDQEQRTATLQRIRSLFPEEASPSEKLDLQLHDEGPGEPSDVAIDFPDDVSPEETGQPEPLLPESCLVADEVPNVAEPGEPGNEEAWEAEIDLTLSDEPASVSPPVAHELPASIRGESAGEEPAPSAFERADQDREESLLEAPSLSDDLSEIDLEIEEEVDDNVVLPQGVYTDETPLLDGFPEIDLEIDADESADSGFPEQLGAYTDESLPGDSDESTGSGFLEPMGVYTDESPLPDDSDESAESGFPEPLGAYTDESPLLDGSLEIDLLEIDGGEVPLALDNLLEEAGTSEEPFPEVALSEPELTLEMPDAEAMMPEGGGAAPDGDALFDLGTELRQEGVGTTDEDGYGSEPTGKYSLDGLFSSFKQAVDRQLDQGDTETHYNLGIAYKEMGLYDDAIAEFQVASQAAERAADCLTLQGICHRDKGDAESAEEAFRKGMGLEGLSAEEALSLKYELALLLEGIDRTNEALQLYREVRAGKPDFRDVGSKVTAMSGEVEAKASEELELLELEAEELE